MHLLVLFPPSVIDVGWMYLQLRVASAGVVSQVRWLNLHEFHSKKMMKDADITVQRFRMAESVDDAAEISKTFSK